MDVIGNAGHVRSASIRSWFPHVVDVVNSVSAPAAIRGTPPTYTFAISCTNPLNNAKMLGVLHYDISLQVNHSCTKHHRIFIIITPVKKVMQHAEWWLSTLSARSSTRWITETVKIWQEGQDVMNRDAGGGLPVESRLMTYFSPRLHWQHLSESPLLERDNSGCENVNCVSKYFDSLKINVNC